jgi:hypothetical protein
MDKMTGRFTKDASTGASGDTHCQQYGFHIRTVQRWAASRVGRPAHLISEFTAEAAARRSVEALTGIPTSRWQCRRGDA